MALPKYEADGHGTLDLARVVNSRLLVNIVEADPALSHNLQAVRGAVDADVPFRDLIYSDAAGAALPEGSRDWAIRRATSEFLNDYFRACSVEGELWSPRRFDALWKTFSSAAGSGDGVFDFVAPLYNFHLDGATELEVGEKLRIAELAPGALSAMLESFGPVGDRFGFGPQFYLMKPSLVSLKRPHDPSAVLSHFRAAAAAMRIEAGGVGYIADVTVLRRIGTPVVLGGGTMRLGMPPNSPWHAAGSKTIVSPEHAAALQGLVLAIPRAWEGLPVAFERMDAAAAEWLATERLVDLVIALEALLLPQGGGQGELSFRLASTGAWLLGQDPDDREAWFHKLRAVYAARSKVVHGSSQAAQRATPQVVDDAWEATRQLLRKYVDSGLDRKSWERHLARVVLGA